MRRAFATAGAAALAILLFPAVTFAGNGMLPTSCGAATRLVPGSSRENGSTAVLLVHGFKGSPRDFAKALAGGPTLRSTLSALPQVALYAFDYSEFSNKWVVNPSIGPALADAIVCLRKESGRRVVVVAHSMGGLATRFAQGQRIDGQPVADSLRQVITIGTPNRGVILLSIANGDVSNFLVRAATEAAGSACDEPPKKRSDLCELLAAARIPAVQAMDPGSPRLKALPQWNPRLPVDGVAADLRLRVSAFGIGTTVSLGDIVVTVKSATADNSPTTSRFVARCRTELTDLVDVVDKSPCSHANEVSNRRIIKHVVAQVLVAQDANRSSSR